MTNSIRLPPDNTPVTGPVVFLAGPIQGAPIWHAPAIDQMLSDSRLSHVTIASPNAPHWGDTPFDYEQQVLWETHWLNRAADHGAILFWMPREAHHFPERAYGQTTRFEYAEWKERALHGRAQLFVGIEPGYSGERYIRLRAREETPSKTIYGTLAQTLDALGAYIHAVYPAP